MNPMNLSNSKNFFLKELKEIYTLNNRKSPVNHQV